MNAHIRPRCFANSLTGRLQPFVVQFFFDKNDLSRCRDQRKSNLRKVGRCHAALHFALPSARSRNGALRASVGVAWLQLIGSTWIYKINQHERMYEDLGIQLVSVSSMCIASLVRSVIVSHFLDTSMIVQVESIRHLSYCLQAESCKWQVQPSPLLLGRESRHGFIGVEMILDGQRWSLLFFFFIFFTGHLRTTSTWTWTHRISDHKKMWAKPDDFWLRWRGVTGLVCIEFI